MGISISSGRRLRAAGRALRLACAPLLLAAWAANAYAGIPHASGAAAAEPRDLARLAQAGDEPVRSDLAILLREKIDGVGSKQAAPAAPQTPVNPTYRNFFLQDRAGSSLSGPIADVFMAILRVELFSESCFQIAGQNEDLEAYADRAWRCVASRELPENCRLASDAVLRSVRFIRFNPNFLVLQESALEIIDRCVLANQRSMNDLYSRRSHANFLDLATSNLRHATEAQTRLVEGFLSSFETHAVGHPPIGLFTETMCNRLVSGRFVDFVGFWLLFCNSENVIFSSRSDRSSLIDSAITERGVHAWTSN